MLPSFSPQFVFPQTFPSLSFFLSPTSPLFLSNVFLSIPRSLSLCCFSLFLPSRLLQKSLSFTSSLQFIFHFFLLPLLPPPLPSFTHLHFFSFLQIFSLPSHPLLLFSSSYPPLLSHPIPLPYSASGPTTPPRHSGHEILKRSDLQVYLRGAWPREQVCGAPERTC